MIGILAAVSVGKILTIAAWIVGLLIGLPIALYAICGVLLHLPFLWLGFLMVLDDMGIENWGQLFAWLFVAGATILTIAGMISLFV